MLSIYKMYYITKPNNLMKKTSMIHNFISSTKFIMFNKM